MGDDYMSDKQFDAMIKEFIASLDRIASVTNDTETLRSIYKERQLNVSKLGYDVEDENLYASVKQS